MIKKRREEGERGPEGSIERVDFKHNTRVRREEFMKIVSFKKCEDRGTSGGWAISPLLAHSPVNMWVAWNSMNILDWMNCKDVLGERREGIEDSVGAPPFFDGHIELGANAGGPIEKRQTTLGSRQPAFAGPLVGSSLLMCLARRAVIGLAGQDAADDITPSTMRT